MILLDTHAWVWWIGEPDRLSDAARSAIDEARATDGVVVSSISVWEVAMLVAKGRLELAFEVGDWIARSEALPFVRFVPVDNHVARRSVALPPPFHPDPADRIITATALILDLPLVTKDRRMHDYEPVDTVW